MSCSKFNPVQSTQSKQQQINWVQAFWQQVTTDPAGCLSQCSLPCVIPGSDSCVNCIQSLKDIYDSDENIPNVSESIKYTCSEEHDCIDSILGFSSNADFNEISPVVLPSEGLSVGSIIVITFGSIILVIIIALVIFYSTKKKINSKIKNI